MWKDVPGFEDLYKVNEMGLIISKRTGKLVIGDKNNCGYQRVTFYKGDGTRKRMFRHRLVAELFVENKNPEQFNIVNHINHIQDDCRNNNLEWCESEYNQSDMHKNRENWRPIKVTFTDGTEKIYDFHAEIARDLNVTKTTARNLAKGKYKINPKYNIKSIEYMEKPNDYRNDEPIYFMDS